MTAAQSISFASLGLVVGSWYHFVLTYDGTSERVYLNGNLVGTAAYSLTATSQAQSGWCLGNASNGAVSSSRHQGSLDQVRIYNKALAAQEVKLVMNESNPKLTTTYDTVDKTPILLQYIQSKITNPTGEINGSVHYKLSITEKPNTPPTANFTVSTPSGITPLSVSFNNSSTDSDGNITSYAWEFGDGTVSTEINPTHTYSTAGTYTATTCQDTFSRIHLHIQKSSVKQLSPPLFVSHQDKHS